MRAVRLTAFGNPVDGLEYVDIPEPDAPGPNQVLIGVEFSPHQPKRPHGRTRHLRLPPPASNRHWQ
jgi:NADPH:quinone reductase-like Zn-dependent oxidoreductase